MQTIGSSACGALRRSAIDFAESRLEIRRPTSGGAELPDQGSVFCERWCARRCRGETVRRWVLKFGLAIARRLFAAMLRGGFTPEDTGKIAGGNYMRIFRAAVPTAAGHQAA